MALTTEANEIGYGGAAGGGKSQVIRVAPIRYSWEIEGFQAFIFRRTYKDLWLNHMVGPGSFPMLLAPWLNQKVLWNGDKVILVRIAGEEIIWGNESRIHLCHCQHEKNVYNYQGAEMHFLGLDEGTHFTDSMYRFLRGRCRAPGLRLPPHYPPQYFPRILIGTNPGNIGHHWFKKGFVDGVPFEVRQMSPKQGGMKRIFIPAKLEDNPSMTIDDPNYGDRLEGLPAALARAMRDGDWNVVAGAYFEMWDEQRHVLRPFKIPRHWTRYRSMDWGSAKPFSVGWWAVSDGNSVYNDGKRKFRIPRGALIRYREWYGQDPNSDVDNVGLRLLPKEVAHGILAMTGPDEDIVCTVADPSMWDATRGTSIAEEIANAGVMLKKADNKRIPGALQVRTRLKTGMIYCFVTCIHSRRTIPVLQHDEHKSEDVNTDMEDHAYDDWRYGCMERTMVTDADREDETPHGIEEGTIDDLNDGLDEEPERKRI